MSFNVDKAKKYLDQSDDIIARMSRISKELCFPQQYREVIESLKFLCENTFGSSSVEVFFYGSRVIGLASSESDLDIFVKINEKDGESKLIIDRFLKLVSTLQGSVDWKIQNLIQNSPIPVIVCTFVPMQLKCDITISNGLAACTSNLLAHLFALQPEAVSLFHFIKVWMKIQEFDKFQTYTITLLVIFYLQSLNFLPSVETVQMGINTIEIEATWEVHFSADRTLDYYHATKMRSYKDHAKNFFMFYRNFDYTKVMSTFRGSAVDADEYKSLYPNFIFDGIFISGPFNKGKNYGNIEFAIKNRFVELCKNTVDFLDKI